MSIHCVAEAHRTAEDAGDKQTRSENRYTFPSTEERLTDDFVFSLSCDIANNGVRRHCFYTARARGLGAGGASSGWADGKDGG